MEAPFIARKDGRTGCLTLGSLSSKNPFDLRACDALSNQLRNWASDDSIDMVVVDRAKHARDFCAGESAKTLSFAARTIGLPVRDHLASYFQLCHLISTFPKPYIAIMDGATRGLGIGLSLLGSHRIATERTSVSFPETSFGSIPNAGATRFLSRLPGELGTWLALTGARLSGKDVTAAGLATHYCNVSDLPALRTALAEEGLAALRAYELHEPLSLKNRLDEMDYAFAGDSPMQIKQRLNAGSDWAKSQATKVCAKSPLSTRIALRQLRTGQYLDSTQAALKIEYRVLSRLVASYNFHEGVRAVFTDMDFSPEWTPASAASVTYDMVSQHFSPMRDKELSLLNYETAQPREILTASAA